MTIKELMYECKTEINRGNGDDVGWYDGCDDEPYCPSATNGDYSPSNPWDAPGMSVRDFI